MNKHYLFKMLLAVVIATMFSCSNDESPTNPTPINPVNPATQGSLKIYAIDTAAIYKMEVDGTSPIKILDKRVNTSSYLYYMTIKSDGSKMAFVESQYVGVVPNASTSQAIHVINNDGSNDQIVFTAGQQEDFSFVQYCTDGKIVFGLRKYVGGALALSTKIMDEDGSNLTESNISATALALSDDRKFYATQEYSSGKVTLIDALGDNGAGTTVFSKTYTDSHPAIDFTNDGAKCVIAYSEGNDIKVDIINTGTFAVETFVVVSALPNPSYTVYSLSIGGDNKTGVFTISGDFPKGKSYVFDIDAKTVRVPFDQRNENVSEAVAH